MIKKYFVLLFFFFLTIGHAQSPEKFTYQSIIKTSAGYLLKNQDVGLKISVLFNSSNGIAVYSEEHTVESNNNGLVTLIIGEGVSSDVFSDIDWGGGEFFLKVEVDPEGGINYTMNQTSQLLSVPYALYAENSSVNLSVIGQSYITYSGNQISANKIDASNDITGLSNVGISGDYADLTNTPTLFDGDYTSLTNKPTLFDGDYANLTNTPTLFDGDYTSLTNNPELDDGKIYMGDSNNKSAQITVSGDVTLANTGAVTIADDAVTTAKLANIAQGSILVGGASDAPTVYDASGDGKILVGDDTDIASVAVSGDVTLANTGAVTIANNAVTNAKIANATIDLTSKVTGVLPIANGGTGASTANAALNSLGLYFGTVTFNGTSVTIDSVSGLKSSSKIFVTFSANDGNDIYVSNINTSDSEFTLTVSGGFSSTATVNWLVIIN